MSLGMVETTSKISNDRLLTGTWRSCACLLRESERFGKVTESEVLLSRKDDDDLVLETRKLGLDGVRG